MTRRCTASALRMTSSTSRTDAASSRSLLRRDILNPMRSPRSHVLTTYSGRQLDLDGCTSDVIFIEDIAAALSKICRFGAQSLVFYSVAQHAVLEQHILVTDLQRPDLSLYGLHHDSHEAFAGDLPSPLKSQRSTPKGTTPTRACATTWTTRSPPPSGSRSQPTTAKTTRSSSGPTTPRY